MWCSDHDIIHRLIPVGVKELNGKVENTHKQDDREFYANSNYQSFEALEKAMRGYNGRWNELRATKSLKWKTPDQAVEWAYVRALTVFLLLKNSAGPMVKLPKPTPPKIKTQRKTSLSRYMQWLEWDAANKKRLRAAVLLPQISQNFSSFAPCLAPCLAEWNSGDSGVRFPEDKRHGRIEKLESKSAYHFMNEGINGANGKIGVVMKYGC